MLPDFDRGFQVFVHQVFLRMIAGGIVPRQALYLQMPR
jgi:hypothetical protein